MIIHHLIYSTQSFHFILVASILLNLNNLIRAEKVIQIFPLHEIMLDLLEIILDSLETILDPLEIMLDPLEIILDPLEKMLDLLPKVLSIILDYIHYTMYMHIYICLLLLLLINSTMLSNYL